VLVYGSTGHLFLALRTRLALKIASGQFERAPLTHPDFTSFVDPLCRKRQRG
jgi:hypothetical protein